MSQEFERIPPTAFDGIENASPDNTSSMPCNLCGNTNTKILGMAEMAMLDGIETPNANTFVIPNRSWGYISCQLCETPRRKRSWLARKFGFGTYHKRKY